MVQIESTSLRSGCTLDMRSGTRQCNGPHLLYLTFTLPFECLGRCTTRLCATPQCYCKLSSDSSSTSCSLRKLKLLLNLSKRAVACRKGLRTKRAVPLQEVHDIKRAKYLPMACLQLTLFIVRSWASKALCKVFPKFARQDSNKVTSKSSVLIE